MCTRILLYICCFFILSALSGCSKAKYSDVQGNDIDFRNYRGKWVFVSYWAHWCTTCTAEIAELNSLNNSGVAVLGVHYDPLPRKDLASFVRKNHINYPVLTSDPQARLHLPLVTVLPTTFLINPRGELVEVITGPKTYSELLAKTKQG